MPGSTSLLVLGHFLQEKAPQLLVATRLTSDATGCPLALSCPSPELRPPPQPTQRVSTRCQCGATRKAVLTLDAAAAHPQTADVRLCGRLAPQLVTCEVPAGREAGGGVRADLPLRTALGSFSAQVPHVLGSSCLERPPSPPKKRKRERKKNKKEQERQKKKKEKKEFLSWLSG